MKSRFYSNSFGSNFGLSNTASESENIRYSSKVIQPFDNLSKIFSSYFCYRNKFIINLDLLENMFYNIIFPLLKEFSVSVLKT
jgi:hypothetical protein